MDKNINKNRLFHVYERRLGLLEHHISDERVMELVSTFDGGILKVVPSDKVPVEDRMKPINNFIEVCR